MISNHRGALKHAQEVSRNRGDCFNEIFLFQNRNESEEEAEDDDNKNRYSILVVLSSLQRKASHSPLGFQQFIFIDYPRIQCLFHNINEKISSITFGKSFTCLLSKFIQWIFSRFRTIHTIKEISMILLYSRTLLIVQ